MSRKTNIVAAVLIALGPATAFAGDTGVPSAEPGAASEEEVRAVFVLNFARFITWPAERPEDTSPLVIGVAGDAAFASTLRRVVTGQTVRGRRLAVVTLKDPAPLPAVHILFIGPAGDKQVGTWLAECSGAAILTVSGLRDFCRLGGMISVYSEDRRIRFEINQESLLRSGLRASSRLLALSKPAEGAR